MRFATSGIMHETHTFSSEATTEASFAISVGDEVFGYRGTNHSVGGVIAGCAAERVDLVPGYFADAVSSGTMGTETFRNMLEAMLDRIELALPVDGVLLTLHGAMVAEGVPDADSVIVRRVRELVGDTPIAVTLDLHANVGQELVDAVDLVTGYDTYPHIDAADRARESVALLARLVKGEIRPIKALVKLPLLAVPQAMFTARPPMRALFERAFAWEASGQALTISVFGGFPYADVPVTGMGFLVTTDDDRASAQAMAEELASAAWARRADFVARNVLPKDAVAEAIAYPDGPVVLVDVGDNIGGGTPGDGTELLAELLAQGAREATVTVSDPEAVRVAEAAEVAGSFRAPVGGKTDDLHGRPLPVEGTVVLLSDGDFVHEGPENAGVPATMGRTAVVRVGGVNLVLTSRKVMPGDLQQLRCVGIEPTTQKIIVVKAAVRWRGGYQPITKHSIDVATPGLGNADLSSFPFRGLGRPVFPLDPEAVWPAKNDSANLAPRR